MAGQIPRHFIDDLLRRIDIVDVIQRRVKLKQKGSNYSACCPFHSEKTPSFTVSQSKQFYHCFGCGAHGTAIGFLMEYDGMHFVDAIEELAGQLGVEVPREAGAQTSAQKARSDRLLETLSSCNSYYRQQLRQTPAAIEYLNRRGLTDDAIERYEIGYAPAGWNTLTTLLPDQQDALLETGMLTRNDKQRTYDRFRDRIMFPIRDRRGRTIAFGGRVMDDSQPKYLNSPETPLFHKGRELYGLFEARREAQSAAQLLIVEGYMDVVSLADQGIQNTVATLGTAPNAHHSETMFRMVPEIVFCFDGDNAGRAAAWRALEATLPGLSDGREAWFLFLPEGTDPDNLVRETGRQGFLQALNQRVSIIDFMFMHLSQDLDLANIGARARLAEKTRPLLAKLPAGIYRQLASRKLESLIGMELSQKGSRPRHPARRPSRRATERRQMSPMRKAMILVIQNPWLIQTLEPEQYDFDPELPGADLLLHLIAICDSDPDISVGALVEQFRDTPHWSSIDKLSIMNYLPDGRELSREAATDAFSEIIHRLGQYKSDVDALKLPPSARTGLLSLRRDLHGNLPGPPSASAKRRFRNTSN